MTIANSSKLLCRLILGLFAFCTIFFGTPFSCAEAADTTRINPPAQLLALFDSDPKYALPKINFINTYEKLSVENQNKINKLYGTGKKEQKDPAKLLSGLDATASYLWSLETMKQMADDYTLNNPATPKGNFDGLTRSSTILEAFPKSGPKAIPLLGDPTKFNRLNELAEKLFGEIMRKANAEIIKNKDELPPIKDDGLLPSEGVLNEMVDSIVTEILRNAKEEIAKNKPDLSKNKTERAMSKMVDTLIEEILRKAKSEIAKNKTDRPIQKDEPVRTYEDNRYLKEIQDLLDKNR